MFTFDNFPWLIVIALVAMRAEFPLGYSGLISAKHITTSQTTTPPTQWGGRYRFTAWSIADFRLRVPLQFLIALFSNCGCVPRD